jgi:hypothetical protein
MPNFKKYDYDQTAMVVVNFLEQLQPKQDSHSKKKIFEL